MKKETSSKKEKTHLERAFEVLNFLSHQIHKKTKKS